MKKRFISIEEKSLGKSIIIDVDNRHVAELNWGDGHEDESWDESLERVANQLKILNEN